MKQVLAISFSFLMILATSGWVSYIHSCGGVVQYVSYFFAQESCGEDMDSCHLKEALAPSCHVESEKDCCQSVEKENDCCNDVPTFVKSEQPVIYSPITLFLAVYQWVEPAFLLMPKVENATPIIPQEYSRPPPNSVPLFLQFQSLVLYA